MYGLLNKVKYPTRDSKNSPSTLDHLFTNIEHSRNCNVVDNILSDHKTVLFTMNTAVQTLNSSSSTYKRFYNDTNITHFISKLQNESRSEVFLASGMNAKFNTFHETFLYYFDLCFPLQKVKSNPKGKNWINLKIIRSSSKFLFLLKKLYPALGPLYLEAKSKHIRLVNTTKKNITIILYATRIHKIKVKLSGVLFLP